jgi:hypothetical protein
MALEFNLLLSNILEFMNRSAAELVSTIKIILNTNNRSKAELRPSIINQVRIENYISSV